MLTTALDPVDVDLEPHFGCPLPEQIQQIAAISLRELDVMVVVVQLNTVSGEPPGLLIDLSTERVASLGERMAPAGIIPMRTWPTSSLRQSLTILSYSVSMGSLTPGCLVGEADRATISMPSSSRARVNSTTFAGVIGICRPRSTGIRSL